MSEIDFAAHSGAAPALAALRSTPGPEGQPRPVVPVVPPDPTAAAAPNTPAAPANGGGQTNAATANNIVIREVEYIQALTERINALIASNERVVKTYRKYFWHLGMFATFIRGVLMGFGWVIGTTIVVGAFALFLHNFVTVPLVGEYVGRIMEYLEQRR